MSRYHPDTALGLLTALARRGKRRIAAALTPEQEARRAAAAERQRWNDEVEARKQAKKAAKKGKA